MDIPENTPDHDITIIKADDFSYAKIENNERGFSTRKLLEIMETVRAKGIELLKIDGLIITTKQVGLYHTLHVYEPGAGIMSDLKISIKDGGLDDQILTFEDGRILHDRGFDQVGDTPQKIYPVGPDQTTVIKRDQQD